MDPETTERFAKLMCERDAEIVRLKFQSNAHRDAQIEGLQEIATLRARLASAENVVEAAKVWEKEYEYPLLNSALAAHAQSHPEKK